MKIAKNSNLENLKSWCCNLEVLKSWLVQSWFKISRLQDQDFKISSFRESWICNPTFTFENHTKNYLLKFTIFCWELKIKSEPETGIFWSNLIGQFLFTNMLNISKIYIATFLWKARHSASTSVHHCYGGYQIGSTHSLSWNPFLKIFVLIYTKVSFDLLSLQTSHSYCLTTYPSSMSC